MTDSGVDEVDDRRRDTRSGGGSKKVVHDGNRRDDRVDEIGDRLDDLGHGCLGYGLDHGHDDLLHDRFDDGLHNLGDRRWHDRRDAVDDGCNGLDDRIDHLAHGLGHAGDDVPDAIEESSASVRWSSRHEDSADDESRSDKAAEKKKPQATDRTVLFDGIHVNHPQAAEYPQSRHDVEAR